MLQSVCAGHPNRGQLYTLEHSCNSPQIFKKTDSGKKGTATFPQNLHITCAQCWQHTELQVMQQRAGCSALCYLWTSTSSWQPAQELVQPLLPPCWTYQLLLWTPSPHSHWSREVLLPPLCKWQAEIKSWLQSEARTQTWVFLLEEL